MQIGQAEETCSIQKTNKQLRSSSQYKSKAMKPGG
jgi:hypothetical protein